MSRMAGRFARVEPRRRARAVGARAAVGPAAQELLDASPSRPGRPPRTACSTCWAGPAWDADAVRDDLRDYVVEHLRRPGRGAGRRRDRGPEEGHAHRRGPAPVHRHRRADRERPGRRLPGLRRPARARGCSTGSCTSRRSWTADPDRCRGRGRSTRTPPSPPSRQLAARDDRPVPGRRRTGRPGSPATRSTAATRSCGPHLEERGIGYVLAVGLLAPKSPPARGSSVRIDPGREGCPSGPGRSSPLGPGPRATASTTGPVIDLAERPPRAAASC